jgi:long-chain acyl-CoA synthetase
LATSHPPGAVIGERFIALPDLRGRGARLAGALRARGIGQDGSVALLLRNDAPFLDAMLAAAQLGAYPVPMNWHFKAEELRYILEDSGARVLVAHADLLRQLQGMVPPGVCVIVVRTPEHIATAYNVTTEQGMPPHGAEEYEAVLAAAEPYTDFSLVGSRGSIVYTSGTTGRPKGVRRLALGADAAARFTKLSREWFGFRHGFRTVMAGPMYHSAPNTYTRASLTLDGLTVLMPKFDAEDLLRIIQDYRITHLHVVPTMMVRLLRLPAEARTRYDLSSLEFVIHGAAPCPPEVKRQMIEWWGPVIHEYYGATECGMVTRSSSAEWLARPGTVGRVWAGRRVKILRDDGLEAAPGEVGEIFLSLDLVPQFTYHNADQARRDIEREGLITNGDMGYLDADGFLFLVDRKKDMVISGGVNIYPAEIEGELSAHPAVGDCAVLGIPDEEFGERVIALVVKQVGADVSEGALQEYLRGRLAGFKVPRQVKFVDALPRDPSGKLMKRQLREPYWAARTTRI